MGTVISVRGIALQPTQGLARGVEVVDTGGPFEVPVGKRLLGRMFNVFGEAIDGKGKIEGGDWCSIHQKPVSLAQQSTQSEIFETGIKAIVVLTPLERGGRAGLFGGAGVGKTVRYNCNTFMGIFIRKIRSLFAIILSISARSG